MPGSIITSMYQQLYGTKAIQILYLYQCKNLCARASRFDIHLSYSDIRLIHFFLKKTVREQNGSFWILVISSFL